MRKGFDGLALLVQETLHRNPHNGNLFVFRGRLADQGVVARRSGHVPLRQAAGTRPVRVAIDRSARRSGADGDDHAGAARMESPLILRASAFPVFGLEGGRRRRR
jgi:hypothetical protein